MCILPAAKREESDASGADVSARLLSALLVEMDGLELASGEDTTMNRKLTTGQCPARLEPRKQHTNIAMSKHRAPSTLFPCRLRPEFCSRKVTTRGLAGPAPSRRQVAELPLFAASTCAASCAQASWCWRRRTAPQRWTPPCCAPAAWTSCSTCRRRTGMAACRFVLRQPGYRYS